MGLGVFQRGLGRVGRRERQDTVSDGSFKRDDRQVVVDRGEHDRHVADLSFDDAGVAEVTDHKGGGLAAESDSEDPLLRRQRRAVHTPSEDADL